MRRDRAVKLVNVLAGESLARADCPIGTVEMKAQNHLWAAWANGYLAQRGFLMFSKHIQTVAR